MLKKLLSASLATVMMVGVTASAYALPLEHGSIQHEHVQVGDIIESQGSSQVVISVNDDSFITEQMLTFYKVDPSKCEHRFITPDGMPGIEEQKIKGDSTYCYKTRGIQQMRCDDCHRRFTQHDKTWKKHKHSYGFLGSECKKCGHKK